MSDLKQGGGACVAPGEASVCYEPVTVIRHLAHELRQPLSTIESIAFYLEMVLPRTESKARRQLSKLRQQVHQINWILSDAIHFLGAAPVHLELIDLGELVAKNLSEWDSAEGPRFHLQLERDLPLVRVDVEQVRHLVVNLFCFFARISRPGDVITAATSAREGEVALEIQTTAPGCGREELESLFEPFNSCGPGASGLALASARQIAQAHHARIDVESDPASGACLKVVFPAGN